MSDMKMLSKLMEKKGKSTLDPEYKRSKMNVLKTLHGEMGSMLGDEVKGLKKVTVASPDKAGLKLGLEKAGELVEGEQPDEGQLESLEPESEEEQPQTLEEVEQKLKELEELKAKLLMKEE